jgi:hypothetical protein
MPNMAESSKYAGRAIHSSGTKSSFPGYTSSMTEPISWYRSGKSSPRLQGRAMSNSTSMNPEAWNQPDLFVLYLYSTTNPFDRGFRGLEEVLDVIESLDEELRPDMLHLGRRLKYSRKVLRERLQETFIVNGHGIQLVRSQPPDASVQLSSWDGPGGAGFSVALRIDPYSFVRAQGQAERRAGHLVSFVRELAARLPLSYGLGHSSTDFYLGSDPHTEDPRAQAGIYEAYWLNVYGAEVVERLGRERLLSTPASLIEELPSGAILCLTRPTPADFDSEEARLAQARALVHLRSELSLESTLARLHARSRAFSPISIQFDPDVADILMWEVEFRGLADKGQNVERFNQYRPPPVTEWLTAAQAPTSDVDDVKTTIETYEHLYAEQLIALFHREEPLVLKDTLEALPRMDFRLWHYRWAATLSEAQRETLVPALGAWLGRFLVYKLGGRWVPRRKLEESSVIVGDRAWLPFLRARRALQGSDAPLDFSCTQFFRLAQRLSKQQAH